MIDVNVEAEALLKKTGCDVRYQYPQDFASLPVITYYTLSDSAGLTADNAEIVQDACVQADIWAASPKVCGELAIKANAVMEAGGWIRKFSMDQRRVDGESVYHKTMRFEKLFAV